MTYSNGRCSLRRISRLLGPIGRSAWSLIAAAILVPATATAQCTGFSIATTTGASLVPGTADIGNHCDDCVTTVALPFTVTLYGTAYSSINLSSNGNAQFGTNNSAYANGCLPQATTFGVAICPHWDDLRTDGAGQGIFTSVSGLAPNRVFNIEWRTGYYSGGGTANFELRLYEDNTRFEVVYGAIDQGGAGATVGVQHTVAPETQFSCNANVLTAGMKLAFLCSNGTVPPAGTGNANPSSIYACDAGGESLLTVNVAPGLNPPSSGITVRADLSSIAGSAIQQFYDNGTNGDAVANDSIFSYRVLVPTSVGSGTRALIATISDAQQRASNAVISLLVNGCPVSGPDVFVARFTDVGYYGSVGNITAYSIGTDACNRGDLPVQWIASGTQHPVIAQNFYRLKNGRFEQIGQSWLKHGFSSTNSGTCGTCISPPLGGQQLGVNCSDAYGSGLNGSQTGLGPRSQVNPTTGAYIWPFTRGDNSTAIGVRLQVKTSDVDPALNAGAMYFGECHYVTADDARWSAGGAPATNGLNNASYQRILIPTATSTPTLSGPIHQMVPALQAWKDVDPGVVIAPADYIDYSLGGAGIVARFWVAAKATNNGDGTWHYEYAVQNLNADRAGGSFSVPTAPGVVVTNIGFHGVFAHSGEPYPNTATNPNDWTGVASNGSVTWTCPQPYAPPAGNNANALRWGTMYNFRFDANVAPAAGDVTLGLFKPGTPTTIQATGLITAGPACGGCLGDADCDGDTDSDDIVTFFSAWDQGDSNADVDGDGDTDSDDIITFFGAWDSGC